MTPPIELGRDSTPQREERVDTPETQGNRPRQNPEVLRYREKLESLKNLSSSTKAQLGEDFDAHISEIESDISKLESWNWSSSHLNREIRKNLDAIESKFDDFIEFAIENIWTEPVRTQAPEPVSNKPETQRWGWWDNDFGQNTLSNQPAREAPKESEAPIDTISPSSSSVWRLNLYKEYLVFKWEWNSALSRFINDIKQHAHLPKIEEVIGEVDAIMENYIENGVISISSNVWEKLRVIKKESVDQRNSMSGQIQDSLIEEEVNPNILFWRFPFVNPEMRSIRWKIERLKEMDINNLVSEITNDKWEINIDYKSMDNNIEKELNQFIKQSKDPELKEFFENNKESILKALEKKKELFNQLKSELQFTVDYYNTNKEHLDENSRLILEDNIKSLTAYMLFINGLHDINILTYFVSVLKRASVTWNVYDMLMLIDDVVAYAFLGWIWLTYVARFGWERKNRNSFLNSTNVDDEWNTSKRSFGSQAWEILKPWSLSWLESMDLEKMYAQFEVNEDGVPQKLKHLSVQAENIKSLIEIIAIYERMWADSDVIIKLTNLKNSAVWWNKNIFSREVFKISYGLSSGNWNHINKGKNWFFRIVDLRLVENIRDIRWKRVIWAPANLPWDNKVSNIINWSINLLFPKWHGIDDFWKKDAPEVLKTFIKQNIEITTEWNRLESWLENNSRSKNPKLWTHNQNTLKYTLREIISESMDESYNQAKTIVDRLEVNWSPITDLETRADLIDKIERVLDQNKWFKNTRIASQIQWISFFNVLRNNWRTNYSVTINGLPLNESTNEISKLIQEWSNSFKDISTSLKKAEGETVGTKNVRNYLIARLNSRLWLSLNVGDVFNWSSISKVSEEEAKARDISKENTWKNLKKLGSHFTWPTPDLSKLSPEDIGKLEKLTDTMLEVEKGLNDSKLPPALKDIVTKNLANVADAISGWNFLENLILKENLTEIPKVASIVTSYSNIFTASEIETKIFPTLKDWLTRADLLSEISNLEEFNDLAKNSNIKSDMEIKQMFKDAFDDPSNINWTLLDQLKVYAQEMNEAKAEPRIAGKDGAVIPGRTLREVKQEIRNQFLNTSATPAPNPNPSPNRAPAPTPTEAWVSPDSNETIRNSVTFDANGNLTGRAAEIYKIALLMDFFNNDWANTEVNKMNDFIERSKGFTDINEFKVELWEITWSIHPEWENLLNTLKNDKTIYQARDIIERTLISQWKKLPANWVQIEIRGWKIFIIKPATLTNGYDDINSLISWMRWKYTIVWDIPSWDDISSNREWFRNISIPDGINTWTRTKFQSLLELMRRAI